MSTEYEIRCLTCNDTLESVDGYAVPLKNGHRWGMNELVDAASLFKQLSALQERCQGQLDHGGFSLCGISFDPGWLATHAEHHLQVVSEYGVVVHERRPAITPVAPAG